MNKVKNINILILALILIILFSGCASNNNVIGNEASPKQTWLDSSWCEKYLTHFRLVTISPRGFDEKGEAIYSSITLHSNDGNDYTFPIWDNNLVVDAQLLTKIKQEVNKLVLSNYFNGATKSNISIVNHIQKDLSKELGGTNELYLRFIAVSIAYYYVERSNKVNSNLAFEDIFSGLRQKIVELLSVMRSEGVLSIHFKSSIDSSAFLVKGMGAENCCFCIKLK